jgi:hypothetical protein
MLLTLGGRFVPGGEVTLTALVKNPARDERLTLSLPEGLQLLPDSPATQDVPAVARGAARPTSPVTWRLVAKSAGTHRVQVRSSSGLSQSQDVIVYPPPREGAPGVFD